MQTYSATYVNDTGRHFPATIFVSSVTLTIRYKDENNEQRDIYWLAERIQSIEEGVVDTRLNHPAPSGRNEQLVIRDPELVKSIKKHFRGYKFIGGVYHHTIGKTWTKVLLSIGVFIALLSILYFWLAPWVGEKIAMNFSKEYEIELGESMYKSTMTAYTIDTGKTRILNEFYTSLHYRVDYPIKVTVVKSKEVNAFAIPGGNIVVNDAILEGMKTPEELAALLGHEASHISQRHSLRRLFRSLARQMFILLVTGNDAGILGYLAQNADALKELQYSRATETDADNNGIKMMAASGIDTEGMLRLMEMLQKETPGSEPAAFMNTHPVFKDRIENIRKEIARYPSSSTEPDVKLKSLFHDLYESW
jgi:beta-barrel assembly-enhancing protease